MAGFQEQWRNLAAELSEHAKEFPDVAWPSRYTDYDPAVVPSPTDDCTFDSTATLLAEAQLCSSFAESEHGVAFAPSTSHYDLCVSRFGTYPENADNPYLRISPYWNNAFVVIYIPHYDARVAMTEIANRYVYAPFEDLRRLVVDWLPRLP